MKKAFLILSIAALFLFAGKNFISGQITSSNSGQDRTDFNINRKIILNSESEVQKIVLPVSEQNSRLTLRIKSTINEGDLTIEVYDPQGEKHGNFSIGCVYGSQSARSKSENNRLNSETVNGQILRTIADPLSGDWMVKIIPNNSSGSLTIESSLTSQGSPETRLGFFQTPFEPFQSFIDSLHTSFTENHPYKITSTFTGTITDKDNKPLQGATIMVKGMTMGTISDRNGNFTLMVPTFLARTLRFSYPGMKNQEVNVGEQTKFIIKLRPE